MDQVDWIPLTMIGKIVMEASKDLFGEYLLCNEGDLPTILSLHELELVFDSYKELNYLSF